MSIAVDRPRAEALGAPPATEAEAYRSTPPVKMWAFAGVVVVAFVTYCLVKWVTGPYFVRVPSGPSDPPTWMKVSLVFWQCCSLPFAGALIYRFAIRPYRRTGTFGADGVIVIGAALMWFQDPLSSATNHWFVYNTWSVNFGSWANSTPGFAAFGKPGAMSSEPIFFTPGAYVYFFMLGALVGCWVMRQARRRLPRVTSAGLIAICFASMCAFDILVEGMLWLPLGIFEYPGGHWGLFASTYHKYPLNEMVTLATALTVVSCLRFFCNDRGQMLVERGIERVQGTERRRLVLRALAGIAVMQLVMFACYNLPNAILALKVDPWPKDLQSRSYFTNYLCGDGTDRPCPGAAVSTYRNGATYVNTSGRVTVPPGVRIPPVVPFDR